MTISEKSTLIEDGNFSILKIIFTFLSIVVLRLFLDNFAYPNTGNYFFSTERFVQAPLYFFSIFFSFSLLLYFLTKASFEKILPFMIKVFILILTVPVIDLIFSGSQVEALKYITINPNDFLITFFKIMNPLSGQGITIGQHIAAYGIFIAMAFFVYKETKKALQTSLSMFLGYLILFSYAIVPSIVILPSSNSFSGSQNALDSYESLLQQSWLANTNEATGILDNLFLKTNVNEIHEIFMARFFLVLLVVQAVTILIISNKRIWDALKKDLRISRTIYWFIIAGIGIFLNQKLFKGLSLQNPINLISLFAFLILIVINIWLAVLVNDEEDIEIDKISNPERPLVTKEIPKKEWHVMQLILLLLITFGTATFSRSTAFLLIAAQASYYIYSTSPLRLKKHFLLSSLLTGLSAVFIAMSGFFLVSPDQHIFAFPFKAIFLIGVSYAILSNLKDIKDFEGDKKQNIRTIPVVFGKSKAKYIIATLYALVIVSLPLILNIYVIFIPSVFISIFIFYLFTKKEYQEKYIFLTFFLYTLILFLATI